MYWIGDESSNFTFQSYIDRNQNSTESTLWSQSYLTWQGKYGSWLVLEVSGELNQQLWSDEAKGWISLQSLRCGKKGLCGNFGICNPDGPKSFDCLFGFRPYNERSWKQGDTLEGCVRNTEIFCSNTSSIGFLQLNKVDFPQHDMVILATKDALSCQKACFINCSCLVYAYGLSSDYMLSYKELSNLRNIPRDVGADNLRSSFFLKLDSSELHKKDLSARNQTEPGNKEDSNQREFLTIVIQISCLALLVVGLFVYLNWRRNLSRKVKRTSENNE